MKSKFKYSWVILSIIFVVAVGACVLNDKYTSGSKAILREIEKITGVDFPRSYSHLEVELATEFCYVGKMRVGRFAMDEFLREMKFDKKTQLQYLTTWGKYREIFQDTEKVRSYLRASGVVNGKNSWEFAYNSSSEELWFFMGFVLPAPPVLKQ